MSISGDEKRVQISERLSMHRISNLYAYNDNMARAAMKESTIQNQAIKKNQDFNKMYETVKRYSQYAAGVIFMMLKKECSQELETWFENSDDVMNYIHLTLNRLERNKDDGR